MLLNFVGIWISIVGTVMTYLAWKNGRESARQHAATQQTLTAMQQILASSQEAQRDMKQMLASAQETQRDMKQILLTVQQELTALRELIREESRATRELILSRLSPPAR